MAVNQVEDLIQKLELEEFEESVHPDEFYAQLLALYLHENNLVEARLLVLRLPDGARRNTGELKQLTELLDALQVKDYESFFRGMNFEWSDVNKSIISSLRAKQRAQIISLIGDVYTSIFESYLMNLMQMSLNEVQLLCTELGWECERKGTHNVIIPKRSRKPASRLNDDQLMKLTEMVSFLEN